MDVDQGVFPCISVEDSLADNVIQRFYKILKPPDDRRSYRGLKLKNEIKILLIHDPDPDKSAVSIIIGSGSLNDFRDVPGIAHLATLLLMAGSKRPSQILWEFEKIITLRGGSVENLSTINNQFFSFAIEPKRLADNLNWFAEFFIEPLLASNLPEPLLDSSVHILQQIFLKSLEEDETRIAQVEILASREKHPYNHLHGGNYKKCMRQKIDPPRGAPLIEISGGFRHTTYLLLRVCVQNFTLGPPFAPGKVDFISTSMLRYGKKRHDHLLCNATSASADAFIREFTSSFQ